MPIARRPLGRSLAWVLLALALLLAAGPATAHTSLTGSSPDEGAVLAAAPAEVALEFGQAVAPDFARAQVSVDGGAPQEVAPVVDGALVRVPLAASGPGLYRVDARVVAADGHPVEASLTFSVEPPAEPTGAADPGPGTALPTAGNPTAAEAPTPSAEAATPGSTAPQVPASQRSDGPGVPWLLLLALGAVLAVGGAAAGAARQRAAARERQDGR